MAWSAPPGAHGSEGTDPISTLTSIPMRLASRAAVVAALAAGLVYIVWRFGFTLDGPALWLGAPLAVAEAYGLVMLGLLAFSCWRLARREVPPPLAGREVAVLVATFNEPEDVLRPTVVGALAIRNDVAPRVWVLDDGGRPWVRLMCEELGASYISRPAPRRHAKAGNINHALASVYAEFIVTLDADHVPRPELLERMLGYFADERVAVVQAPQHFYNRGFQHPRDDDDPLRNEQSLFFDAICRGKDRHDAAFWCGCPSVIRREALVAVGGVATDTVVEDAHTSMRLNARGWRVAYHHEVMALGLGPEEIGAFVVQRGRWARGSMQMLRRDPPMLKRGLTWAQRLEYTANCMHFLEGPQRLIGFLMPAIVLSSGLTPIDAPPLLYAAIFLPQLVLIPLASKALTRGEFRLIESERFAIARMTPYLGALVGLLGARGGFRVTPKGGRARTTGVARALWLPISLAIVTVGALGYQVAAQVLGLPGQLTAGAYAVTVLWASANVALVVAVVVWARGVRHVRWSHRFPVSVEAV
jgi:cellulose synthase/poly-beta-1,6-N-acetylglucosamine synthase-like glycosyltransferase